MDAAAYAVIALVLFRSQKLADGEYGMAKQVQS